MSEEAVTDEAISEAIDAIHSGKYVEFEHVLCLVGASWERNQNLAPQVLVDAISGKYETDYDYDNGGADQFVWNHGAEIAREIAEAWRTVGAVENADLLMRLADEFASYASTCDATAPDDSLQPFLDFRRRVGGPSFRVPAVGQELAEAAIEWAIEHAHLFEKP